jgi:hypothetical protein
MVNLTYFVPRMIRHFLPESVVRYLLNQSWIIKPGTETILPSAAVQSYQQALHSKGIDLTGKRVMIFGYGGNYAVGGLLLQGGAGHVVLCEKEGFPEYRRNRELLPEFAQYLKLEKNKVIPNREYFTLLQGDIQALIKQKPLPPVDIVLSFKVYEHLSDADAVTDTLVSLTAPDGMHLHFIDLRDHYFRFPFDMLCYSEQTWQRWLNPSSNHNRYRLPDYQKLFARHFRKVDIEIQDTDIHAFELVRHRIRPEFLTGDAEIDSVTKICVAAYL